MTGIYRHMLIWYIQHTIFNINTYSKIQYKHNYKHCTQRQPVWNSSAWRLIVLRSWGSVSTVTNCCLYWVRSLASVSHPLSKLPGVATQGRPCIHIVSLVFVPQKFTQRQWVTKQTYVILRYPWRDVCPRGGCPSNLEVHKHFLLSWNLVARFKVVQLDFFFFNSSIDTGLTWHYLKVFLLIFRGSHMMHFDHVQPPPTPPTSTLSTITFLLIQF